MVDRVPPRKAEPAARASMRVPVPPLDFSVREHLRRRRRPRRRLANHLRGAALTFLRAEYELARRLWWLSAVALRQPADGDSRATFVGAGAPTLAGGAAAKGSSAKGLG